MAADLCPLPLPNTNLNPPTVLWGRVVKALELKTHATPQLTRAHSRPRRWEHAKTYRELRIHPASLETLELSLEHVVSE